MASIVVARESLSYAEARARVLAAARPLPAERVPIENARGRALRETLRAPHGLPPFRNSSMDGFAVRAADVTGATTLPIVDTIPAGRPPSRALRPGEAMRIMTGAMLPEGSDAVVPVEDTSLPGGDRVEFTKSIAAGANIRDADVDLPAGEVALSEGRELSAADLGLLAALGVPQAMVGARPRVTILSTGDELLNVDQPLKPGAIRDSNSIQLRLLVEEAGGRIVHMARLADDARAVRSSILEHAARCDVLLTIGGVSMGEFDPVKQSLGELRGVAWWRVAMKPGQPQAFGRLGEALYFGLPGNPASVACVFEVLVRPALRALQGFSTLDRPQLTVRSRERIESRTGRTDFVRVVLESREGTWWAAPAGAQVSGHLTPQSRAHALMIVPESAASPRRGRLDGRHPAALARLANGMRLPRVLILCVAAACLALTVTFPLTEPDFWQHLVVGRVIWETHSVPQTQIWTWPTWGAPDVNLSWGFRALVHPFWELGGVTGLFAWRWLTTLGAFALLWLAARRMGASGLTVPVALVVCGLAWSSRSQIRPETWVAVLMAVELWILESRRHGGPDRTWALPLVFWIWINSHISWHFGILILAAYGLDALLARARWPSDRGWPPVLALAVAGVAGLALGMINPFGWRALWQPFHFLLHERSEPIYATIGELEPLRWSEHVWDGVPVIVIVWPLLAILRARRQGWDWAEVAIGIGAITAALSTVRFVGFLGIVAAPFLARDLDWAARSIRLPAALGSPWTRAALAGIVCVLVALPLWRRNGIGIAVDHTQIPERACDRMAEMGIRGRSFNRFHHGGYLLWRFYPERDRLPFMDIHQAGTPELRRLYMFAFEREEYWRELDQKFDFEWMVLPRRTYEADRLVDVIDADTSWAMVFLDDAALVFVRRRGPMAAVADSFAYRTAPAGNVRLQALAPVVAGDSTVRAAFRADLERQTRESPFSAQAHEMLATVAMMDGRTADARTHLERSLAIDPRAPEVRARLEALSRQ